MILDCRFWIAIENPKPFPPRLCYSLLVACFDRHPVTNLESHDACREDFRPVAVVAAARHPSHQIVRGLAALIAGELIAERTCRIHRKESELVGICRRRHSACNCVAFLYPKPASCLRWRRVLCQMAEVLHIYQLVFTGYNMRHSFLTKKAEGV